MNKRLREIRHVALDMDGTIYSGGTLFETTLPFLGLLPKLGIGDTVLIICEGSGTRQVMNNPDGCVNSMIIGIVDSLYIDESEIPPTGKIK